jgi:hypothetical protein
MIKAEENKDKEVGLALRREGIKRIVEVVGIVIVSILSSRLLGLYSSHIGFVILIFTLIFTSWRAWVFGVTIPNVPRAFNLHNLKISFVCSLMALFLIPFVLESTYTAFGESAFRLNGEGASLQTWGMLTFDQLAEALFFDIPKLYFLSVSKVTHVSVLAATVLFGIRMIIIVQFLNAGTRLYRFRKERVDTDT